FKFLTLFVLGLVATALVVFVVSKVAEQRRYQKTVQEFQLNQSFALMTDNELLHYARDHDTLASCPFVKDHNKYYACLDRIWRLKDCSFELIVRENLAECYYDRALREKNVDLCYVYSNLSLIADCESHFISLVSQTSNVSFCGTEQDTSYKIRCLQNISITNKNESFCDFLGAPGVRLQCKRSFYPVASFWELRDCGQVSLLLNKLASTKLSEAEKGVFLNTNSTINKETRNFCAAMNASLSENLGSCSSLGKSEANTYTNDHGDDVGGYLSDFCTLIVAAKTMDEKACASINDVTYRISCMAITKQDVSVCASAEGFSNEFCRSVFNKDYKGCSSKSLGVVFHNFYKKSCNVFLGLQ
ncbi:hypothetical protein HZB03_02725, partial [Candidatus Woesearchaeota archaeon]|nr:hypothetical protein [Candidatus Woesearchaeota archaeon]